MFVGDLIKEYRSIHNLSQRDFAKKCNLSHTYIAALEKNFDIRSGKPIAPTLDAVKNIAKAMNVTIQDILDRLDPIQEFIVKLDKPKTVRIPILGRIVAGVPITCTEEYIGFEEIEPQLAETGDFFALVVRGNSMEPSLYEGDIVVVRKQNAVDNGDIAVILVNGEEATIKRVVIDTNGITLVAYNSAYLPRFYSNEDIEKMPVIIVGRVMESKRKYY